MTAKSNIYMETIVHHRSAGGAVSSHGQTYLDLDFLFFFFFSLLFLFVLGRDSGGGARGTLSWTEGRVAGSSY